MKRTTLFLDESTDRELRLLAQQENLPVAALVRDALGRFLREATRAKEFKLRFLAAGRSGHHDTAERAEELLWGDRPRRFSDSRNKTGGRRKKPSVREG